MSEESEPRTLHPVQMNWGGTVPAKDFSIKMTSPEVEDTPDPAPKDSSAVESVSSLEPPLQPAQIPTAPAPGGFTLPTAVSQQDADSESGKPSEQNEDESRTPTPTTPVPETSSPASSLVTSPGKSKPPAPAKPPTAG